MAAAGFVGAAFRQTIRTHPFIAAVALTKVIRVQGLVGAARGRTVIKRDTVAPAGAVNQAFRFRDNPEAFDTGVCRSQVFKYYTLANLCGR
ncbi:MAG: hypothetical protein ACR2PT_11000 [Endozoicomonas sp.]